MSVHRNGTTPGLATARLMLPVLLAAAAPLVAADPPDPAAQIAAAVLAAPEEKREGATVIGWNADGTTVELRKGDNKMVCLAADPRQERWSVACYHQDLEPFMARGRELAAEGLGMQERQEKRFAEIESGQLEMPREPRTLYVLHGSGYDAERGEITDPYLRWVLYVPYATAESTGLSTSPTDSAPWLMGAGTPGAHIMINPPREESGGR
ncbi:MAG TPA: hypothetical protein VMT85_22660 [Thermoanaerobaculia bacterium]|nr:hypothetical protein [Thermoanaerobaculia bacterium]